MYREHHLEMLSSHSDTRVKLKIAKEHFWADIEAFIGGFDVPDIEKLWLYLNGKTVPEIMCVNGSRPTFVSFNKGYLKFCGNQSVCACNRENAEKAREHRSETDRQNIITKRKTTNREKYGADFASMTDAVKHATAQTCIDRYGVKSPTMNAEILDKVQQSNLHNHGVAWATQSTKIIEKVKETNRQKFGTDYPSQNPEVVKQTKNHWIAKYGRDNPMKVLHIKEKLQELFTSIGVRKPNQYHFPAGVADKLDDIDWLKEQNQTHTLKEIAQQLGISIFPVCHRFKQHGITPKVHFVSSGQRELTDFIRGFGYDVTTNNRHLLKGYELDIFVPSKNIAFEYDGLWWHSINAGKPKTYHSMKTKLCAERGITLIHVWENEWLLQREIVESRICAILGNANSIYARKTEVVELDHQTSKMFFSETHLQGHAHAAVTYGLLFDNDLVAAMSFSKSRYSHKYEWEILRYSSGLNTTVIGGAGKLLNAFITHHNPSSIISYADLRWGRGKLYEALGFEYINTSPPNYFYFKGNMNLQSRNGFQKHKLKGKLDQFDPAQTEIENMRQNGWNLIYDCGNAVYALVLK